MNIRQLLRSPFVNTPFAEAADLSGKSMIVTGASLGSLGYATARQLARWGATVTVTTRSNTSALVAALNGELNEPKAQATIDGHDLDLCSTDSVEQFSQWYMREHGERLDCLINNAGVHLDLMSEWKEPRLTADDFEIHWRTNYLGTVQLTDRLLPLLQQTGQQRGEARVVNVVSQLHSRGSNVKLFDPNRRYESWQAYGLSKLALIHHSHEMHRRYAQTDKVKSYCLHPGGKSGAYTNVADKGLEGHALLGLLRKLGAPLEKLFMATAVEGAQTQLHCATSPKADGGHYYVNLEVAAASEDSQDKDAATKLWQSTEEWLNKPELQQA
jgi:retinol dehydrogenase-12